MAVTRHADAIWKGDLPTGGGTVKLGSGAYSGQYSFKSRFENGTGTNPEELLGAAHAGCFAMAFSLMLSTAGHKVNSVHADAAVTLDKVGEGFKITKILLTVEGDVPGIDEKTFLDIAGKAKAGCPISQALAATPIEMNAKLAR